MCSLPSRFFAARIVPDLRRQRARARAKHVQSPRHPHRLPFHEDDTRAHWRTLRDRGADGQADAGPYPTRCRRRRAGDRQHRQRRPLRGVDGGAAAAFAVLLLRHGLRAGRSRRRPQAQHHDHARRRRQCARRRRAGGRHPARLDAAHRARRQDDPPRRVDQAHPQPLRPDRRPDRRQGRHPGAGCDRPGVRQAHQGIRRRDRLLQPQQAQRRRLTAISPTSWSSRPGATT